MNVRMVGKMFVVDLTKQHIRMSAFTISKNVQFKRNPDTGGIQTLHARAAELWNEENRGQGRCVVENDYVTIRWVNR